MNIVKLRNQVHNVLVGRLFETLAFCVMYFMVIGMFSMLACNVLADFSFDGTGKLVIWFTIALLSSIILYALLVVGKNKVMLKIINGDMFYFSELFTNIKYGLKALGIILICAFSTIMWSLLFVVPGVNKGISYSMSLYILANNPEKGIFECIEDSKKIMQDKKIEFLKLFIQMMTKVVVLSILLVVPYILCVYETSNIIIIMFATFTFVCVYPMVLFIEITYCEIYLAVFYEQVCDLSYEEKECIKVINKEVCNAEAEVA